MFFDKFKVAFSMIWLPSLDEAKKIIKKVVEESNWYKSKIEECLEKVLEKQRIRWMDDKEKKILVGIIKDYINCKWCDLNSNNIAKDLTDNLS
jgi:hypothetical protein